MLLRALCPLQMGDLELAAGDEFEADDDNASRLVRRRQAEPVPVKPAARRKAKEPADEPPASSD